jgi:crotonobetainyl-CoA:carnitine CoA-transferase CaiB-like acyl-CoA transferase
MSRAPLAASPIKTAGAIKTLAPGPGLGEHTDTVLSELLHYPPERIAALRAARVLGDAGPEAPTSGSSAP